MIYSLLGVSKDFINPHITGQYFIPNKNPTTFLALFSLQKPKELALICPRNLGSMVRITGLYGVQPAYEPFTSFLAGIPK